MKYLLLLLLILAVIWVIQRNRIGSHGQRPEKPRSTSPSSMVTCAHCGIHLPQEEAVTGVNGLYCGTEHRSAAQDRNPA